MRVMVKYTKGDRVKYISHLDFMRLVQRALRRADIPVAYSQGYNPHPRLSFASALAVGITSQGEYLDIFLEDYMDPELLCNKMNQVLPEGIEFIESRDVDDKFPSLASLIERAKYRVESPRELFKDREIHGLIHGFLSQTEIWITRENKQGHRQVDIRPMIHTMDIIDRGDKIIIEAMISTGSRANLRPEALVKALFHYGNMPVDSELLTKIHRLDLYCFQENRWLTPIEMG